jgi:hypothetical protein
MGFRLHIGDGEQRPDVCSRRSAFLRQANRSDLIKQVEITTLTNKRLKPIAEITKFMMVS